MGSVLAFDFGARRIGVAIGDTELRIAHPLEVIAYEDNRRRFDAIAALIAEWRPGALLVGRPGDDPAHPLAAAIARFARRLHASFGLPVHLVDESLSSWVAGRRLSEAGIAARDQGTRLDAMAACVILETWFAALGANGQ
ncbi:MAG: Holliday junction resolvase RuvX [Burkholderiales bacterium]|nr:Holliday junction resolvase RuvX [Burkholderiales bacterium]